MIGHIDVCLCICKITLQRSSLKIYINVIEIDTCTTEIYSNFHFLRHLPSYCMHLLQCSIAITKTHKTTITTKHHNHYAVD